MNIRTRIEELYDEARDGKNERYINEVLGSILARKIAGMIDESTVPREIYDSLSQNFQTFRQKVQDVVAEIPRHKETIERRNSEVDRMSKDIRDLHNRIDCLTQFSSTLVCMLTHTGEACKGLSEALIATVTKTDK